MNKRRNEAAVSESSETVARAALPRKNRRSGPDAESRRPRIQEVAAHVGMSVGTVSAVLNGNGRASSATRDRVQQAIKELGYRPDLYASNLARRQTRLLGLLVSNLQNSFFAETAQAIEQEAERNGYQVSLMNTNFSPVQQRAAIEQLLQARISGLAVITSEHDEASRRMVLQSGVPAVFLDLKMPEANVSTIRVDSRGGMRAAVEHLLAMGHSRLLFVRNSQQVGTRPLRSHQLRSQGFLSAVRGSKHTGLVSRTVDLPGPGAQAGERAIAEVFAKESFTAVIASTDEVALGVYHGLQRMKLRVPEDVSVVGFDNVFFSQFLYPPLTTVDVPRLELSRLVLDALLKPSPGEVIRLQTSLVVRSSTAPARARERNGLR